MSEPVSGTCPVDLDWHISDCYLPILSDEAVDVRLGSTLRKRPVTSPLAPLWTRIVTGKSFGWRLRRLRRQARRAWRNADVSPQRILIAYRRRVQSKAAAPRTAHPDLGVSAVVVGSESLEVGPLRVVGRQDGAPVDVEAVGVEVASHDFVSYRLPIDGRWLASHVPTRHPPIAAPVVANGPVITLAKLTAQATTARRRSRAIADGRQSWVVDATRPLANPILTARWIIELVGAGSVVCAEPLDPAVSELLGSDLATLVERAARLKKGNRREREHLSIEMRRAVHRYHSAHLALGAIAEIAGIAVDVWPTVTVLMATKRPEFVFSALEQVASQEYAAVEVLCGLHECQLDPYVVADIEDLPIDVRLIQFGGDRDLGQVLSELADQASGVLVTKWDDDDWYSSDHIADLVAAMRYSGADLVGKAAEYVYLEGSGVTVRRFATGAENFSTTIAGATLMLRSSFLRELGGWPAGSHRVDRLLIDTVERAGGYVYRLHGDGFLVRRAASLANHTWRVGDAYFLDRAVDQRYGLDFEFAGVRR